MEQTRFISYYVKNFVLETRKLLNRYILLKEAVYALFFCLVFMNSIALWYVFRGYKVYVPALLASLIPAFIFFLLRWILCRYSFKEAVHFADNFFDLKDSLTSSVEFAQKGMHSGLIELQYKDTVTKCGRIDFYSLKNAFKYPLKTMLASLGLSGVLIFLCMQDDSPKVKEKKIIEKINTERTAVINDSLRKTLREIKKGLSEEEHKIFKKTAIEKMFKDLKTRKELKPALLQYAEIERKLNKLSAALNSEKEEKLLKQIAKELLKKREYKKLGNAILGKHYSEAADILKKISPEIRKNLSSKYQLTKLYKKNEALRKLLKKMMTAAEKNNSNCCLKTSLKNLTHSSCELSKKLSNLMKQNNFSENTANGQLEKSMQNLKQNMNLFCRQLIEKDAVNKFLAKLKLLKLSLSEAQSLLTGNGMRNIAGTRGIAPGRTGSSLTKNKSLKTSFNMNGYYTRLKGIKNTEGKSATKIVSASQGYGRVSLGFTSKKLKFVREIEGFISREDVPPEMREGVKKYFKQIHK